MVGVFGRCVHKEKCELNCQVFVGEDGGTHSTSSICLACKHLAAFHEQGNLINVGLSTRPPPVEKLTAKEGTPCTNTAINEAERLGKTKSFTEWKAEKSSSAFREKSKIPKKSQEPGCVTVNIGLMLFDEKVMALKAKWGKKMPITCNKQGRAERKLLHVKMSSGATYAVGRHTRPRAIPLALTKISRIDGLPNFLTHGAPRAFGVELRCKIERYFSLKNKKSNLFKKKWIFPPSLLFT